ncbi:TerC family protein [Pediococcus argentinicus]|uniref:TerC family protein n=1 Tax=Pediococcus argentinicus TaxID=480391 RepID=UPI00338F2AED
MSILSQLYGPFFDLNNWEMVITSQSDWLVILSLVMIECILSVDNAVVLATQTQALPDQKDREKSLFYGLWGAYIFRFLIIGVGTFLIHLWEIKVVGALYLIYLVYRYFDKHKRPRQTRKLVQNKGGISLFWRVVIQIEFMDIVFSVDSVLASLAISSNPVIVLIGGLIGILCMRGIAEIIMNLMKRVPELETMAYVLIAIIAVKLFLSIPMIDIEIPSGIFALVVIAAFAITFLIHFLRNRNNKGA